MELGIYDIFISLGICLLLIALLAPVAIRVGLEDKPNERKHHNGHIPLIGGIAIFLTILAVLFLQSDYSLNAEIISYLAAAGLLVAVGAVDDRYHLNVKLRMLIEAVAASIMVFGADQWVGNLGNLLGVGELHMPFWVAYPFTLVAVFGIINAFNMIDGIDGLSGGLALVTITAILVFTSVPPLVNLLAPIILGGLIAFLLCNLQLLPFMPKTFLGDAGSKLIGLTIVWFIISITTGDSRSNLNSIAPVTALYLVGLPLFDMVATTLHRRRRGVSPFEPDRSHIHHILLDNGLGARAALLVILALSVLLALLGILLSQSGVAEAVQFGIFFALYFAYSALTRRALKIDQPHTAEQYQ